MSLGDGKLSKGHADYLGQAPYSRKHLFFYDRVVLGLSNRYLWKCPTSTMLDMYTANVGAKHLDVGPGTGFFLDKCAFPVPNPHITLLDLNETPLAHVSERISRYRVECFRSNILEPVDLGARRFSSIGINYVLHCLRGGISFKARYVFENLAPYLLPGGVVFGATIVGIDVNVGQRARLFMQTYNRLGAFNNHEDSVVDLESVLAKVFSSYTVDVHGCVALFSGKM